ncbi:MAG: hydroxymethylglutaryl-CoA lyase [Anaerolineae bacterium]|nr:hydroxymethylglutaryl-CoA lyase [Anaerolineae bacterium]
MDMEHRIRICEVGPRDGLQNEPVPISTAQKRLLISGLIEAGLDNIEVTSFVNPKLVPQMADSRQVMARTLAKVHDPDIRLTALVLNERGYDYALESGATSLATLVMVSNTLSERNSNMSRDESLALTRILLRRAREDGIWMRVYIGTAWTCPYEGDISPNVTIGVAEQIWDMRPDELAIADTIGHAQPLEVGYLMKDLVTRFGRKKLAIHLHDTQALGLVNAAAAIHAGVRLFDASVGGLGGCPFAPGAAGNLATEDLVFMAHKMGFETGVDLAKLWKVVQLAKGFVNRPIGGRIWPWWEAHARPASELPGIT